MCEETQLVILWLGELYTQNRPNQMPAGMIGSKKKGGKIKRTGRYKLHKGEEEVVGKKVVGKVKKTGPRKLVKGEKIIPANKVAAKKKTRRKRG